MTAFDDYLAQLRRLDELRRGADEAAAHHATATESLGQRAERLAERAVQQRAAVDELARRARVDVPARGAQAAQPGGAPIGAADVHTEVAAAEADLEAAASDLEAARFLAHRPPWLPRWRADERNGLIYGIAALVGLFAQMIVLRLWTGDGLVDTIVLVAVLLACPLAAFTAGWLAIGVVSRPRIGEPEKLQRNPRLGLVICASTLVAVCFAVF